MKSKNIFTIVGVDYHDDSTPIISDGKYFFVLGDYMYGIYTMCCEVSNKDGGSKDNDSHFEDFEMFYGEDGKPLYKMIQ